MWRYGNDVPNSARGLPPLSIGSQCIGSPLATDRTNWSSVSAPAAIASELPPRRKAALKKAFKRLDPVGNGFVAFEEAKLTLCAAPSLSPAAQQELVNDFSRVCSRGPDGRPCLTFAAFGSYYHNCSLSVARDSDFEQLLQAHWGYLDVSDILASMQRQFASFGMAYAFQDLTNNEIGPRELELCLKRIGLLPRPDDLLRVYNAFAPSDDQGLKVTDFREQVLNPRPETPIVTRATRDLVITQPQQAATVSTSAAMAAVQASNGGRVVAQITANNMAPQILSHESTTRKPASDDGPAPADDDLESELAKMEAHISQLRKKKNEQSTASSARPASRGGPAPGVGPPPFGSEKAAPAHDSQANTGPPANDEDLDSALSNLQDRLHKIKSHTVAADNKPMDLAEAQKLMDLPPLEIPHWEAHKYGHHKVTQPAWHAASSITDSYGQQHNSSDYGYNVYGAGGHGHHLAHYHLNDYQGLDHHSYKPQEYQRHQFGDAAHHGHFVPHLHGIGTQAHHSAHSYNDADYHRSAFGKGCASHWVPHLHGIGESRLGSGESRLRN